MNDELEQPVASQDSEAAGNTAAEEVENEVAGQQDDADGADADSQEQTAEDDPEEEIEIGDKKFALPKSAAEKLKAERMMQADYTKKTQEVAEHRKAVEARDAEVQRHAAEAQEYLAEIGEIHSIDKQLAMYRGLDWARLIDENPKEAMLYQQQQRDLETARTEVANKITTKRNEKALAEQQSTAKQIQEAETYFKREIPGWSPERSNRIADYAAEQGIPKGTLAASVLRNPALVKVLNKAEMFDQLQKKQAAKPKEATPEVKPVTRITASRGGAQAVRNPDDLPMDQWLKWRDKQLKAAR
jgi:hypothetical protein